MSPGTNDENPTIVKVLGELDDDIVQRVKHQVRIRYGDRVLFAPGRVELEFDTDWQSIGTLAGLVIGTIGLTLQLVSSARAADEWTKNRLDEIIQTELFRYGITETDAPKIRGFENLLERANAPCVVEIIDRKNREMVRIYVQCDGAAFTLRSTVEPIS